MRQEDSSKPRNARWRVFGRLSTLRTVASIMMIALFLSGCATSRKASVATEESVKQVSADTLQSEVRQTWTETVPQEEAKLEIPLAELTNLPEKAEYRAKNGRASATVQNKGGIIVVYATCDSLQRQCEYYERQMASYKKALEQQKNEARTDKERSSNPWKMLLIAFIVGVATGTVLTIITRKIWQKVRNSCTASVS